MIRSYLVLLGLLWGLINHTIAQDTILLYFESGSAQLSRQEERKIEQLSTLYDLNNLDSIRFVGRTDTTGKITDNQKLSRKRAQEVRRSYNSRWNSGVPQSTQAQGESKGNRSAESRRVDLILYFTPAAENPVDSISGEKWCYRIDYRTLRESRISYSKGKRRPTVSLEMELSDWRDTVNNYHGQQMVSGEWRVKKVRWRKRKTGFGKWTRMRVVANIPRVDFDSLKILTRNDPPCDSCSLKHGRKVPSTRKCLEIDYYLMRNLQFKKKWFNPVYRIRVPSAYVDSEAVYRRSDDRSYILWKCSANDRYCKSHLLGNRFFLTNILKEVDQCQFDSCSTNQDSLWKRCATPRIPARAFGFELEGGYSWYADESSPFVGVTFNYRSPGNYSRWLFGFDNQERMYSSWQTQFTLLDLDFNRDNLFWQGPQSRAEGSTFVRLYVGTEVRAGLPLDERPDFVEQNVHLGFASVPYDLKAWFAQWYVQGGVAYEYSDLMSESWYPIFRFGLNFKLVRFRPMRII